MPKIGEERDQKSEVRDQNGLPDNEDEQFPTDPEWPTPQEVEAYWKRKDDEYEAYLEAERLRQKSEVGGQRSE